MRTLLAKSPIDGFIASIFLAVVVAAIFPAGGVFADVMDWVVTALIALLFFLYGTRLSPREALDGLTHWRLHTTILAFTFLLFPLIGLALHPLLSPLIGSDLADGFLYMTLVPSTVQSSIAFTSIARGNVPGAIVSASASNLFGVVLTPALVVLLMSSDAGVHINGESILEIVAKILVPFIIGQLARPLVGPFLKRYAEPTKYVDRGSIVMVVYVAFSEGVQSGLWSKVDALDVVLVIVVSTLLVALMLTITWFVPKRLGFNREDMIAAQFCGTKKSLATGLPLASVMFTGSVVGFMVLPLMIFHQIQLIICAWLANRYHRQDEAQDDAVAV
ncbi:bile acid:sodium symporter [Gordonia sp. HY002]|uniref:bile acid:sodium symporter family protein n=1 Tax=Gordonia zhenghanii TaxID=2911516 RepID=UPI001EF00EBB|nr:bile acid:sodium symporter family protein [Gordonia zhenghanii]MCF8571947.1 bile acid:sodium symporter [Gordonia zhenghanii]MCF8604165.1 bile acid:sodium symporter [Gordonia zhenghanii]